jgi:hypothetical protein
VTDKIAIVGLVVTAVGGIAVPLGLALLDRSGGSASETAPATVTASGTGAPATTGSPSAPPPGPTATTSPGPAGGKTIEISDDYYADLDSGKIDQGEGAFQREADIALLSYDLTAATYWDSDSDVRMAVLGKGAAGPGACARATAFTPYVTDEKLRVGTQLCVRTTEGRMVLLRVQAVPEGSDEPPTITLAIS